jgi:hypothetical protein
LSSQAALVSVPNLNSTCDISLDLRQTTHWYTSSYICMIKLLNRLLRGLLSFLFPSVFSLRLYSLHLFPPYCPSVVSLHPHTVPLASARALHSRAFHSLAPHNCSTHKPNQHVFLSASSSVFPLRVFTLYFPSVFSLRISSPCFLSSHTLLPWPPRAPSPPPPSRKQSSHPL